MASDQHSRKRRHSSVESSSDYSPPPADEDCRPAKRQSPACSTGGDSQALAASDEGAYSPPENIVENGDLDLPQYQDTPFSAGYTAVETDTGGDLDAHRLPHRPVRHHSGLDLLIKWIDTVASVTSDQPTAEEYYKWQDILTNLNCKRDDLAGALVYATLLVNQKRDARTTPELLEFDGITTGMPLKTIPWEVAAVEASVERMSSMAIRSGILQACVALCSGGEEVSY